MQSNASLPQIARGIGGAIVGGAIGFLLFWLLARFGLHALVVPGASLGLGCGYASAGRSIGLAIAGGIAALALGVVAEWALFPFLADESLVYFIGNLGDLPAATQIMLVVGGLLGGWFAYGRPT